MWTLYDVIFHFQAFNPECLSLLNWKVNFKKMETKMCRIYTVD